MMNNQFCEIFDIPFFQFAQMKKYCPEDIPIIKAKYKANWEAWKALSLDIYRKLGIPFAEPHIVMAGKYEPIFSPFINMNLTKIQR